MNCQKAEEEEVRELSAQGRARQRRLCGWGQASLCQWAVEVRQQAGRSTLLSTGACGTPSGGRRSGTPPRPIRDRFWNGQTPLYAKFLKALLGAPIFGSDDTGECPTSESYNMEKSEEEKNALRAYDCFDAVLDAYDISTALIAVAGTKAAAYVFRAAARKRGSISALPCVCLKQGLPATRTQEERRLVTRMCHTRRAHRWLTWQQTCAFQPRRDAE